MGYVLGHFPIMPRKNDNATKGGRAHSRRQGSGWMKGKRKKGDGDRAPLTPGGMHSQTRIR